MPVQETQNSPNPAAMATLGQWLELQPVIDEVARVAIDRGDEADLLPDLLAGVESVLAENDPEFRPTLVQLAAASLRAIHQYDLSHA